MTDPSKPPSRRPSGDIRWTARPVRPAVAVYVLCVFVAFMALAWFVFDSAEAVGALAASALASLVALAPMLARRVEYRLDGRGIFRRRVRPREESEFTLLCSWDDLVRLEPTAAGFKYFRQLPEAGSWTRFVMRHVSDRYSGELHVEPADRSDVTRTIAGHRIGALLGGTRR